MKNSYTNTHGGARAGSGRKPLDPSAPAKSITITLSPAHYEWLRQQGKPATVIRQLIEREAGTMKPQFDVWASNDQGAHIAVASGLSSVSACERQARAELGKGWTVHVDQIHFTEDGEMVGKDEVKRFRISK